MVGVEHRRGGATEDAIGEEFSGVYLQSEVGECGDAPAGILKEFDVFAPAFGLYAKCQLDVEFQSIALGGRDVGVNFAAGYPSVLNLDDAKAE